jgi:hypothetical protein
MDKKLRTRILIAIVAVVWIYNIYRTYENYQVKEEMASSDPGYQAPSFSPLMFNKDSFDLELPEIDPFLKRPTKKTSSYSVSTGVAQNSVSPSKNKKKPPKVEVTESVQWPSIKYFGFVKNRNKENELCLVQINGRNHKLSKGDRFAEVLISSVYRDSILVVYGGEKKTIRKG